MYRIGRREIEHADLRAALQLVTIKTGLTLGAVRQSAVHSETMRVPALSGVARQHQMVTVAATLRMDFPRGTALQTRRRLKIPTPHLRYHSITREIAPR